jgi:hypothetical protein
MLVIQVNAQCCILLEDSYSLNDERKRNPPITFNQDVPRDTRPQSVKNTTETRQQSALL